jgi:hypothetical protein
MEEISSRVLVEILVVAIALLPVEILTMAVVVFRVGVPTMAVVFPVEILIVMSPVNRAKSLWSVSPRKS